MNDYDPTDDVEAIKARWQVAKRRSKFWMKIMFVSWICMVGATLYDISLPGSHWLWVPFVVCFVLAAIGGHPSLKAMRGCNADMTAINQRLQDDYYRLVTGQERQ